MTMTETTNDITGFGNFMATATYGAGFIHGFCDAYDVPIQPNLEQTLMYAPSIVIGSLAGPGLGLKEMLEDYHYTDKLEKARIFFGFGLLGLTLGAGAAGLANLLGYGLGYTIGYFSK